MDNIFDEYKKYIENSSEEEIRRETISWLENTRSSGGFVGFDEEEMNFEELTDDEIYWYFEEWVFPDKFNNGDF